MYGRHPSGTQWPRWLDLPPDLLREISGRLVHVTNLVRFHAVCRAWRSSHDPSATKIQSFLPWLLAPSTGEDEPLNLRCVFSNKTFLAPLPSSQPWQQNWVGGADGAALRYFTAFPYPRLHDPLVTGGGVTTVTQAYFPYTKGQWPDSPSGITYRDGTILLYKNFYSIGGTAPEFKAAILHPGDASWTVVERTLESPRRGEFTVAYHRGKILVTEDASLWHMLTPGNAGDDMLVPRPWKVSDNNDYWYENSYVLESHGELIWVVVYTLEEGPGKTTMQWARKHGKSLADHVLFLGRPNSFAIDASRLGRDGGCAYFMCYNYDESYQRRWCVIRYNLVDNRAEIIEWLPQTWQNQRATWLILQPTMAPIKEIRERLMEAPKWKRLQNVAPVTPRSLVYIGRLPLQPCFRILVCNLPLTVNSSQLRLFFSKLGEVSSAKIICYEKTKTSQGRGLVTLATVHARRADALASLNRLVWDGYSLRVSLVNDVAGQRRRPSRTRAKQLHIARSSGS